jgi:RHS repeat-associated protein
VIFVYDQSGHLLGEYGNTGAAIAEYVWLGDEPVAVFTPNGTNPPNIFHIHNDHLGTPRAVLNTAGQLRWRWLAEPFATTAPETNPAALGAFTFKLRMPGQYADSETGLFYNYFRDYDAGTGRYVQSDPIGLAGGINTYAYVGGNPVSLVDPEGLQGFPVPRGTYLPRGPAISGPPTITENGGIASPRALMNPFTNMPNPAPQIPGGYVGINFPWSMPNLGRVCTLCVPAGNSLGDPKQL